MSTPTSNKSLLWNHFDKTDTGKGKCRVCKKELATSGGNTTGLARHLETHHKAQWKSYSKEKDDRDAEKAAERKRKGEPSDKESKRPKGDFFKPNVNPHDKVVEEEFHDLLIDHIADTCTSFGQYGGASFQKLVSCLNRKVKVKHPSTLSRMAGKKAAQCRKDISAVIRAVKPGLLCLGFTTDLWTSRAMDSYISLTLSFIDESWEMHRYNSHDRPHHCYHLHYPHHHHHHHHLQDPRS